MMGFLAQSEKVDSIALRKAIVYGTVAASFTIGDFSIHGISSVSMKEIEKRFDALRMVTQF
jgi:predicted transcriptional regulator